MKKFLLLTMGAVAVLYIISYGTAVYFGFQLVNVVLILGITGCFITYGGNVSRPGERGEGAGTLGDHLPEGKGRSAVHGFSPYFTGSLLTVLSGILLRFLQ